VKAVVLHLGSGGPPGMGRRLEHLYRRGRLLNRHYVNLKLKAVAQRQQDFTILWDRVKGCLDRIVPHADSLGIKLGAECRSAYEEWPDEREMETVLQAYAGTGLGYWHDFGHAARKEFLGFHTHAQTLAKRASRLWGCHVHDGRPPSADHLALGDGEIDFAALVPLLPTSAMPVLELHPRVRAEQVIESRTRWEQWVKGNVCVSV
jgi:sugar phosphate isomerase/epimerase